MLNLTQLEKGKIKDLIRNTIKNNNLEFEVRVLSDENTISHTDFINVIKKIKSGGFKNVSLDDMMLDIYLKDEDTTRITVHGDNNILVYCNDNSLKKISDNLEFIEKSRFSIGNIETKPLDLRNYNLRVNLKEELILGPKNKKVQSITNRLSNMKKMYRYKKRFSFISPDKMFRYDLTIIKKSTMENVVKEQRTITKGEVNDKMKRLVLKPKGVRESFTEWWDNLSDEHIVTLREQRFMKKIFYNNLTESETLTNPLEYEIELEYIGNKNKGSLEGKSLEDKVQYISDKLSSNLHFILQGVQNTDFVISRSEIKDVKNDFYKLTKFHRFTDSMPMAITLERDNIIDIDVPEMNNIRKNYSVTEKTDGDRNLLFIDSKGIMYLINRKQAVRKVGITVENYTNTIIDGELVSKNLLGGDIRLFLCFDLYFSNGVDFRERILMRSMTDRGEGKYEKSRLEELEDVINSLVLNKEECQIEFVLEKKVFKYGNVDEGNNLELKKLVEEREEYILNNQHEITEESLKKLRSDINLAKQNTKIFEESQKILIQIEAQQYNYLTDGLIFTPIYMTVGEGEKKRNKYGGRWSSLLKWKPVEENSIDFLVKVYKNEDGSDMEKFINIGNDLISYKKVKLLVGYDKEQHKYLNGFRVLNENIQYLDGYSMIPFEPLNPFAHKIYEANIQIQKNGFVCQNGDSIKDNSIVEFSYDKNASHGFYWIPLRVRDNLVPNAYSTACNVWHTIFNPITIPMITTGENIPKTGYYGDKKNSPLTSVYKFHNLVKKSLLQENCKKGDRLLDLGCGEFGDLFKYISLDLDLLVALDYDKNNLVNDKKGAFKRILEYKDKMKKENKTVPLLDRTFLIWGDCGKNIANSSAGRDSLSKFYIDVLWGNVINRKHIERLGNPRLQEFRGICQGKFNIISSQFALHYFFKNSETLSDFLSNISENLVVGGKFLATFFDGRKIFELLQNQHSIFRKDNKGNLLWRIDKKYDEEEFLTSEKSLGLPINVYVETFADAFEEYLVNIDFLRVIFESYGLEIISIKPFEDFSKELGIEELTDDQKLFSYLNVSLVAEKKREVSDSKEMSGGGEEKKKMLDIFISKKEQLGGDLEQEYDLLDTDTEFTDDDFTGEEEEDMGSDAGEVIEDEDEDAGSHLGEVIEENTEKTEKTEKTDKKEKVINEDKFLGGEINSSKISKPVEEKKEELDVVRLEDLDLEPEFSNLEQLEPINLDENSNENTDYNLNVNTELGDLNTSILNIQKNRQVDNLLQQDAPIEKKDVKVIKLDGDKNVFSLIKK